ncbi:MAG: ORF6N domain-containing protein [Bdellovibrionia bacterium]
MEASMDRITQRIHVLRGQKVMLDYSLAELYEVETKVLKRSVRRNLSRFPNDFMLELTEDESKILRLKFAPSETPKQIGRGGNRYTTFAFTESGVAMLSSILKSQLAVQVNITVMRAFIQLRQAPEANTKGTEQFEEKFERRVIELENRYKLIESLIQASAIFQSEGMRNTKKVKTDIAKSSNSTIDAIQKVVAMRYNLKIQELKSTTRSRRIALPRQIAIYLIRSLTDVSFKEIAAHFGKDHTTILYACRKIERLINKDKTINEIVQAIQNSLQSETTLDSDL